jgi:predicted phosphodiesterase
MRVFALSDIHVDYDVNAKWVRDLSQLDYRDDVLILAGDVTHKLPELAWCLRELVMRFKQVLFVPGNHDVWVLGEDRAKNSLQKFADVAATVAAAGASMQPFVSGETLFAPLFGWYDYTFGEPSEDLKNIWMDYHACRWPAGFGAAEVASHFLGMNQRLAPDGAAKVITFSHFLPRLDLLPAFVSPQHRILDPVLGSTRLEGQLRQLNSSMHVYGHSHINRRLLIDGVTYINNAFGYPGESRISARQLLCIDET